MPADADDPRLRTRDALALGLLHGPAELLPVSSSGHVAIVPWLCGWPYSGLDAELRKAFEVALHAGTAAALLIGLRAEVADAVRELDRRRIELALLSFLPPAIAGLALERPIERRLGTPATVAAGLAAGAVAMVVADAASAGRRRREDAGARDALWLGVAQACALVPGVSRNGATFALARARGFTREDAGVLSRHVALPVIAGATVLKGARLARRGLPPGAARAFGAGSAASFATSSACVRIVRHVERGRSPLPYAIYRLALAGLVVRRLQRGCGAGELPGERAHSPSSAATIEFRSCAVCDEPAATLVGQMRDELAAVYRGLDLDARDMPKAGPRELGAPHGTFVVGYEDGVPVCCGGIKRLPDGACEIKRMFVVPAARGRGVARALLDELEARARELGYAVARLDTGPRQPRAQRMYERAGYAAIENFNANPVATFFGEKRLSAPGAREPSRRLR